jgi:hypothetical protein
MSCCCRSTVGASAAWCGDGWLLVPVLVGLASSIGLAVSRAVPSAVARHGGRVAVVGMRRWCRRRELSFQCGSRGNGGRERRQAVQRRPCRRGRPAAGVQQRESSRNLETERRLDAIPSAPRPRPTRRRAFSTVTPPALHHSRQKCLRLIGNALSFNVPKCFIVTCDRRVFYLYTSRPFVPALIAFFYTPIPHKQNRKIAIVSPVLLSPPRPAALRLPLSLNAVVSA